MRGEFSFQGRRLACSAHFFRGPFTKAVGWFYNYISDAGLHMAADLHF
jgi:hypothetical protein